MKRRRQIISAVTYLLIEYSHCKHPGLHPLPTSTPPVILTMEAQLKANIWGCIYSKGHCDLQIVTDSTAPYQIQTSTNPTSYMETMNHLSTPTWQYERCDKGCTSYLWPLMGAATCLVFRYDKIDVDIPLWCAWQAFDWRSAPVISKSMVHVEYWWYEIGWRKKKCQILRQVF